MCLESAMNEPPNCFPLETVLQKLWFEIFPKYFEVILKQEVN